MQTFLILIICFSSVATNLIGTTQSVGAEGRLLCNKKPVAHAVIRLYDTDRFGFDDFMGEVRSKDDGTFLINGTEHELTSIDPVLKIYHRCRDLPYATEECHRLHSIEIPDDYITLGEVARHFIKLGDVHLDQEPNEEKRECL